MTPPPLILIVEDDDSMSSLIAQGLTESGFRCRVASNGSEAAKNLNGVDLIVSDIMMPVMNGLEMTRRIRSSGNQTPIIFLTAKDQTKDTVSALEAGGDDYIIKPFNFTELVARIHAMLRRARVNSELLSWEDIEVDCKTRKVTRGQHELFLSTTEFSLLEYFVRHPNQVWSKSILLHEVWQDDGYRDDNIVELYVNYLRKKTESFGMPRVIHTVRGQGYILKSSQS